MSESFIEAIEDSIQMKLQSEVNPDNQSNAAIEIYPDKPDAYILAHAAAALLVRYVGSRATQQYNGGLTKLEAIFEVTIMTRRYRDGGRFIARTRDILRHFAPLKEVNSQYKLSVHSDGFIKYTDKGWQHFVRFSILLFDPITVQGMMI